MSDNEKRVYSSDLELEEGVGGQGRVDDSNSIPSNEGVLRSSCLKKPEADLWDCVGCFGIVSGSWKPHTEISQHLI